MESEPVRPGEGNEQGRRANRIATRQGSRNRALGALAALATCVAIATGLGSAQADQLPDLPPPPAPSGSGSGSDNGSPDGYPNATENQAENLFTSDFSATVQSLAQDPPDLGPDATYLNDRTALIGTGGESAADLRDQVQQILEQDSGDIDAARSEIGDLLNQHNAGTPQLVSSTQPLRAPTDNGQQAPVDLSLEPQGTGYVPDNPLVELMLPNNLSHDVTVGGEGIKVDVGASDAATADGISGGDNLFYHEAATDTDVVLAPLSVGFETLYQLRSPQSPEQLEMGFTLPAGASLEDAEGKAALILRDGQTLATIPAPTAQDANGNPVPVNASVSGDSLTISVPHQDPDLAYPINVDPVVDAYLGGAGIDTDGSSDFTRNWTHGQSSGSYFQMGGTCTPNISCYEGTYGDQGLYINAPPNHTYNAGQAATWLYTVPHWPSSAYISDLQLFYLNLHKHNGTSTDPYLAAGIFAPSTFSWVTSQTRTTEANGLNWDLPAPSNQQVAASGQMGVFQLYTGATNTLTHWRDAYLGLALITLADTDNPTVSVNTTPLTSGWIDGKQTTTFQVPVADGGLGVSKVFFQGHDYSLVTKTFPNQNPNPAQDCQGTRVSTCPSSGSATGGYYADETPEGQQLGLALVYDALGKAAAQVWNVRVDRTSPDITTLSGGLSPQPSGDPYALHVHAIDGNANDPMNWRSGVRRIRLWINDNEVLPNEGQQDCTPQAGSCPMTREFTFDPNSFTSNQLHFKVMATDQLGHARSDEWDVTLPNTSIDPDSGPSGPTNDPTPSFGYSSTVSGSSFQCKIDGGTFASCPASGYTAPTSPQLAEGNHTFYVRAINPRGQVDQTAATRGFTVDTQAPNVSIDSGPAGPTSNTQPIFGFSSSDSTATFSCSIGSDDEDFEDCSSANQDQPADELYSGLNEMTVRAIDPAGNSSTASRSFIVDTSSPHVTTTGSLTGTTGTGPYALHVEADDGDSTDDSGADWESGVKRVDVYVNGSQMDTTGDRDCAAPAASCPLSLDYTLNPDSVPANDLHIRVTATDEVAHVQTEEWDTTITGADTLPRLNLSGGLFTAPSGWVDQLGNANLSASAQDAPGATQLQLLIDGQEVDQVGQSCPGGGCVLSHTFSVNPANYTGGSHTVQLVGTDAAGNTADETWVINVDPAGTISASEATSTLDAVDATTESGTVEPPDEVLPASEIADGYDPALQRSGTDLQSTGTPNQSSMTTSVSTGFTIDAPDRSYDVTPTTVSGNATTATVASSLAAVTGNARSQVDAIVSPIYNGDTTSESIRSADSPESYSWQVDLASGQTLESTSDQSAEVYDADGSPAMLISTDLSPDATGADVPTTLSVSANTVTLTISHQGGGFVYPIVGYADWQTGYRSPTVNEGPSNTPELLDADLIPTIIEAPVMDIAEQAPVEYLAGHPHKAHRAPASQKTCAQGPLFGCNNWETWMRVYFHFNGHYGSVGGFAWRTSMDNQSFKCQTDSNFPIDYNRRGPHGWRGPRKARYGLGRHLSAVCNYVVSAPAVGCQGQKIWVHPYGDGYFGKGKENTDWGCLLH